MVSELATADVLQLHELVARYAHIIDRKEFADLAEIFTEDATFDASDFGRPACSGVKELVALMSNESDHPQAHHATNVVLDPCDDDTARILSKGLAVLASGRVQSLVYYDLAVRTPAGWRLRSRVATAIRPT